MTGDISDICNPWKDVCWNNPVPKIDNVYICSGLFEGGKFDSLHRYQQSVNDNTEVGLTFNALPEPYSGYINSQVYCLNINPGTPDENFGLIQDKYKVYEDICKKSLRHQYVNPIDTKIVFNGRYLEINPEVYDRLLKGETIGNYAIHKGTVWYRRMIKSLEKVIGCEPYLFFIEFFPYHSMHSFNFPKYLPSYEYRDYLIERAMLDMKTIIILRAPNLWFGIKRNNLGLRLRNYPNTILLNINRKLTMSPKCYCKPLLDDEKQKVLSQMKMPFGKNL